MSVPDILKSALPFNTSNPSDGVSTPKPVKTEFPLRQRNQSIISLGEKIDKPENVFFTSKNKNPPKPPEEFYKDLQQFHERRG